MSLVKTLMQKVCNQTGSVLTGKREWDPGQGLQRRSQLCGCTLSSCLWFIVFGWIFHMVYLIVTLFFSWKSFLSHFFLSANMVFGPRTNVTQKVHDKDSYAWSVFSLSWLIHYLFPGFYSNVFQAFVIVCLFYCDVFLTFPLFSSFIAPVI